MGLAERIRQVREKAGLGQKEFGARVGVSKNTQLRYENGQSNPPLDYLERVASEYGIDSRWLITGSEGSQGEELTFARYRVLSRMVVEIGLSWEQVGMLTDLALGRNPKWPDMLHAMVRGRMLAALSPAERIIIESYRAADDSGKRALEMTAAIAKRGPA